MMTLQYILTDNFTYAFKIQNIKTKKIDNHADFFTDFDDDYIGFDAMTDEFRTELPDSTTILELSLSVIPPAEVVFPLHLTTNNVLGRIG